MFEDEEDEEQEELSDNTATPEKRASFLAYLSRYGNVSEAARKAHLNRPCLYRYRDENPEFDKAWREAEKLGALALEDEARRRAYIGTLKPVFHQGAQCGVIREYSDTLMIFLLKGHNPEKYAERQNVNMNAKVDSKAVTVNVSKDEIRSVLAELNELKG